MNSVAAQSGDRVHATRSSRNELVYSSICEVGLSLALLPITANPFPRPVNPYYAGSPPLRLRVMSVAYYIADTIRRYTIR